MLIPELCGLFYSLGWVTGTGGGISMAKGLVSAAALTRLLRTVLIHLDGFRDEIFIAPSGVQKERMKPDDMFVVDREGKELQRPTGPYKMSQCTPLFFISYTLRDAGEELELLPLAHSLTQQSVLVL